ncbi:amidohydrolase [Leucobacter sp. UCD-THU]|uniref:amidohydrolase n=1 Tax=Leucobacter sp. UCD-THU TaxID=1292023 RepID=UPI00036E0621|nr:amidohydrolase [Leucobacter sp. UCD-THU]EYT56225.1 amidohydrolase [Leucobacter sp. UCD-THU]
MTRSTDEPASRTVDAVFENGWIHTGLGDGPRAGGIAVGGGRILSCDAEEVARLAPRAAQRIDLDGRLLIPGFQDAHAHPVIAGTELLGCDLSDCPDAEAVLAAIRRYAEAHPERSWIIGAGWSMDAFPGGTPTRDLLDAVVPDRPVLLENRDHHSAWANTRAFLAAGIDETTPDPRDGRFEREPDGTPAGTVHDGAMFLFDAVRAMPTEEDAYAGLLEAQRRMLAFGVTAWQDAAVGSLMGRPDTLPVYLRALERGALLARVRGAQWWDRTSGVAQLAGLIERRDAVAALHPAERFSLGTVKIMVDGVAESRTAAMHGHYRDHAGARTDSTGIAFFPPAQLAEFVAAIAASGMQVHFHALGDRAVTDALDALEHAARSNGDRGLRHHLAHLETVAQPDLARFAELGATANLQPLWAAHDPQLDELVIPFLPDGVEQTLYPFAALAGAGAPLAAGSDWPVSSPDPIQAIHVAVNRRRPGSASAALGEAQALTVGQAVNAYTSGTARVNHLDHVTGRLRAGRLADLAVLDRNLFAINPEELHTAVVDETWIDGRRVYSRQRG